MTQSSSSPGRAVWLDGALVEPADAVVSVFDHGFTVGDGVFETLKLTGGQPFAVTRHLDRLERSAAGLGLSVPLGRDKLRRAIDEVIAAAGPSAGRMRITLTGGPGPLGSDRGSQPPTLVIVATPVAPWDADTVAVTVPWPRNERSAVTGLKTTSYAENVRALAYAKEHGGSEAIFANTVGDLCEGTGSNIFCVFDGELVTPTLESGALSGVTRNLVLAWFGGVERDVPLAKLAEADEIFLTSTTRDVQAIHRADDRDLAVPGEVTAAVAKVFAERSADDLDP
jgi:branched-chain amino acid aminotransferase